MKKKVMLLVALLLVVATLTALGCSKKKTQVVYNTAPDGEHVVAIYTVGDADFPYGATHCEMDMLKGKSTLNTVTFDLKNDGKAVDAGNFTVIWQNGYAEVTVSAEEQDDDTYILYY